MHNSPVTKGIYLNKKGKMCVYYKGKEREIASVEFKGTLIKKDGTEIPIKSREVKLDG
jgi:hypothetical protein